jgi:hypothetical protein
MLAWLIPLSGTQLFAVGEKADAIVIVADSRNTSGLRAWWMNLYNESHLLFAVMTIIILPVTGLILGKLTGGVMARLGINLKSRELAEH